MALFAGMTPAHTMGATNAAFQVPNFTQTDALYSAAVDLLNYLDTNGVPSQATSDANVLAFQRAWNADPGIVAAGATAQLDEDGGYGPNTYQALNHSVGGVAPNPLGTGGNTNPQPAPKPAPGVLVTPNTSGGGVSGGVLLLLAAVGVGAYFLLRKKKGGGHKPIVEIKQNPRRRRASRARGLLAA